MKKFTAIITTIILSALCFGCGSFGVVTKLPKFKDFIANYTKYEVPLSDEVLPAISGYAPIVPHSFESGRYISGNTCYVTHTTGSFILKLDGSMQRLPFELEPGVTLNYDTCTYKQDGKIGLKDALGNVLIPAQYDLCETFGSTTLCTKDNVAYTFDGAEPIAQSKFSSYARLLGSSSVLLDDLIYDVNFDRIATNGYFHVSETINGMTVISENSMFGFVGVNGEFIKPVYDSVEHFTGDYAVTTLGGDYCVIDRGGNVLYKSSDLRIFPFYDNYFCFSDGYYYGILDERFDIVYDAVFSAIYGFRVYGKYIVCNDGYKSFFNFFDIETGEYVPGDWLSVTPAGNHFICQNHDKTYSLLNANLIPLIENCDSIESKGSVLRIGKDEKIMFYRLEE